MSSEISFPLKKIHIHKRAVVAGRTVSGRLLRHLRNIVVATAGADAAVEKKIHVPGRAGALEGAAMAAEDFLYSLHRALPFQGFDQEK